MQESEASPSADEGKGALVARPVYLEPRDDTVSLLEVVNVLLRHRRLLVGLPLAAAFVTVLVTLVLPRKYTVETAFMPESGQQQAVSNLSGLAAQFGFSLPTAGGGQSPAFYASLITSRQVLEAAVQTEYPLGEKELAPEGKADLLEVYGVSGDSRPARVERAVKRLRDQLNVSTDVETGLVEFSVSTRWSDLSQGIAKRILDLINRFNLERRQSQASAERAFLQGRVTTVRGDLHTAEDSLQMFLDRNRSYQNSPRLVFEHDRLQRRVTLQQQVYASLVQSLEQAKIQEVRDTPVITVVAPPQRPALPDRRRLLLKALLGFVAGGLLALVWIAVRAFFDETSSRDPATYGRFSALRSETAGDLRRLWSALRRRVSRGGG